MPRNRIWGSLLKSTFVVLASVILLEIVLQVGALLLWWSRPAPAEITVEGQRTILCVGDSWTQGMGSSDMHTRSYPAVLAGLVSTQVGAAWHVVNCGVAGQDSRDVLERLPDQLRRYAPDQVVILVGQNDEWNLPAALEVGPEAAAEEVGSYRLRWRLPRFVAWLAGKLTGAGQAPGNDTIAGLSGPEWEPWEPDIPWNDELLSDLPRPGRRARQLQEVGREQFFRDDLSAARRSYEELLSLYPEDPLARRTLVSIYQRTGESERAHEILGELRRRWLEQRTFGRGQELITALDELGRYAETRELARELLRDWPEDDHIWSVLARALYQKGDREHALEAIDAAIARAPRIHYFGKREQILRSVGDLDEAMRTVVAAYRVHNDARWALARLRNLRYTPGADESHGEIFRRVVAGESCDPGPRARLQRLGELAYSDEDLFSPTLALHLEQMIERCHEHGARPTLLSYPMSNDLATPAVRRVAAERGARFLDLRQAFLDHGRVVGPAGQWPKLRAPDGHCNDDGYALMARFVAVDLFSSVAGELFPGLPLGRWRGGPRPLTLRPDGSGRYGDDPVSWQQEPNTLLLPQQDGGPVSLPWRLDGDRLHIPLGDAGLELTRDG